MKHLKKFNESGMIDPDINDILLELTDIGCDYNVTFDWWNKKEHGNGVKIVIYGKEEYDKEIECNVSYIYDIPTFIETIERLVTYLGGEGYTINEVSKKKIDSLINFKVLKHGVKEVTIPIDKYNAITLRYDKKTNSYKICYNISFYFSN